MHPKNKGIGRICQQGMEGKIGLVKIMQGDHGQGNTMNIPNMGKYCDMYVLGGLKYDQHDLRVMSRQHNRTKLLIYDGNTTDELLIVLEEAMPDEVLNFLDKFDDITFGDVSSISDDISSIFQTNGDWKNRCKIISDDVNKHLVLKMMDENESVENYRQIFNENHATKPLNKKEMLIEIENLKRNVDIDLADNHDNTNAL